MLNAIEGIISNEVDAGVAETVSLQEGVKKKKKKNPSCQLSILWMFIQMPYIFSNPHWDTFSQVLQGFLG